MGGYPRRAGILAATGAIGLAWWALWHEPRRILVRRCKLALPRWPASLAGMRIGVISDLHAGAPHVDERRLERVVERMNRQAPDLVALLGDYVDPAVTGATWIPPERVAERLGRLRAPLGVIAVLGNHDWRHGGQRIWRALREAGIAILEDETLALSYRGERLYVAGLADARNRAPDPAAALAGVPDGAAILALSHDPDLFPRIPDRVALTLAGHTHAGQVNLPLIRRRFIPSRFGDRYAHGHVEEGGRHLFVTAGIGTSGHPARFRSPPEIVVLALQPPAHAIP